MEIANVKPNLQRNTRIPSKKRTKKIDTKPECILKVQGEYLKRLNPCETFIQYQAEQLNRIYKSYMAARKKPQFSQCELVEVNIQSATTPSNIYVSKAADIDFINEFHQKLNETYTANETDSILVPNVDEICCGQTEKNGWQRCRILGLHMNEMCTVQLIDIGHKERIKWSNLRMLDENTFAEKPLAIKCSLVQIHNLNEPIEKFSMQQLNQFNAIIQKRENFFYIFVSRIEAKWCGIILYVKNRDGSFRCLNRMFPNEERESGDEQLDADAQALEMPTNECLAKENPAIVKLTKEYARVEMSDREGVVLLHFESLDAIFICLENQYKCWDTFHSHIQRIEMQRSDDDSPRIVEWRTGDQCLVPDIINDRVQWYRGRIIGITDNGIVTVYLRDVGKTLNASVFSLRSISDELMKKPIFARKSSLAGIMMAANETIETIGKTIFEMIETFDGLAASGYGLNTTDKSLILWGVKKFNEDPYAPTQFEYTNINRELAKLGLVVATTSFKDVATFHAERDRQKAIERHSDKITATQHTYNDTNRSFSICKDICEKIKLWPQSEPFEKIEFVGFPMYINSKFVIYLLDDERKRLADKMSEVLTQRYKQKELQRFDFYLWQKGSPCFAPFEGQFHRATIRKVYNDDTVVVRFIDYGNAEKIHIADIKKADMFENIPVLARPYRLHNIKTIDGNKWPKEVLKFVDDTVMERQCNIQVVKCSQMAQNSDECNIEIFTKDKTLQNALFTRKFAVAAHDKCN